LRSSSPPISTPGDVRTFERTSKSAFAGWWMLLAASLAAFLSGPAQTFSVSAFVDPMISDLGMSRSLFSTIYSVGTLTSAGVLLIVGRQIDRYGSRIVITVSAIIFAAALATLSIASGVITLLIGFSLLRSFGSSVLNLGARTLVPRWFHRRIGLAFSLFGLAGMLSQALIPPVNNWLIGEFGWRMAWRLNGFLILLVLVPIVAIVVRNRPEDLGQLPDGAAPDSIEADRLLVSDSGPPLREAWRTAPFWGLIGASAVPALVVTGLSFNQVAIMTSRGLPSSLAATTFAIDAAVYVPTALLSGWLVDRVPVRWVLAAGQVMLGIAMLVLIFAESPAMAIAYAVCRGLSGGLWMVAADVAWPSYFGRRHLGSIRGFGSATMSVAAALGPIPFGLSYDMSGGYTAAIAGTMIFPVIAAIAVFVAKPPTLPLVVSNE